MRGGSQFAGRTVRFATGAFTALFLVLPAIGQMHGPGTWASVGGHPLAPAPSVTSVSGPHLPPPLPSVTSIPNFANTSPGMSPYGYVPYFGSYYRTARRGYRYGNGYGYSGQSYAVPYYVPVDSSGYGYDYVGGPPLYSGPPAAYDPTLHMIVEQPPARQYRDPEDEQAYLQPAPPAPEAPAPQPAHDAKPGEPTLLVFRDGHKQEVINYAIMGQTLYVFDKRTQKITLADLDLPATIKANDDAGVLFSIPAAKSEPKKALEIEPRSAPDSKTQPAENVAAIVP